MEACLCLSQPHPCALALQVRSSNLPPRGGSPRPTGDGGSIGPSRISLATSFLGLRLPKRDPRSPRAELQPRPQGHGPRAPPQHHLQAGRALRGVWGPGLQEESGREEKEEVSFPARRLPSSRVASLRCPSPRRPGQPQACSAPAQSRQPAAPTLHSCSCAPSSLLPREPLLGKS